MKDNENGMQNRKNNGSDKKPQENVDVNFYLEKYDEEEKKAPKKDDAGKKKSSSTAKTSGQNTKAAGQGAKKPPQNGKKPAQGGKNPKPQSTKPKPEPPQAKAQSGEKSPDPAAGKSASQKEKFEIKKDEQPRMVISSEAQNKDSQNSKNAGKNNKKKKSSKKSKDMEDIKSYTAKAKFKEGFTGFWTQKGHTGRKMAVIILLLVMVALIVFFSYFYSRLSLLGTGDQGDDYTGGDEIVEDIDYSKMDDITNAASLNDLLKKWSENGGEKMSSRNVINILLLGIDSSSNLSDSMMLVSLNKKTQEINMVSFFRDSYTYMKTDSGKTTYTKMNASYAYGGAALVIKTLENNYKIIIDDYALVDYNSFPKVIDALGGVTVNVEGYEAKYMNSGYGFHLSAGSQKLNGEEALKYCRIRHTDKDGDVSRTRRQRTVITAIMNSFKSASVSEIDNAITVLFPKIKTSMSKSDILGYGTKAITNGWLNFKINQVGMPTEDTRKGGYVGSQWVWIVDYPGAAYQLQTLLYGKSNIELKDNRVSAINLKPTTTKAYSSSTTRDEDATTRSTTTTQPSSTATTKNETTSAPPSTSPPSPSTAPSTTS